MNSPNVDNDLQGPQSHVCPSCGYCDHCKRGGHHAFPYNPYPWTYPYSPYWSVIPPSYYPNYVGGTITQTSIDTTGISSSMSGLNSGSSFAV